MLNQIDLNLIPILESLSRTESVKKTAQEFHVSSSAISQSITKLEVQLGVQLLLREHKQVRIAPMGVTILQGVTDSLRSISKFLNDVKTEAKSKEPTGLISLGCPTEFGSSFLITWFSELQKKYPKIKIKLRFGSPRTLISSLLNGEVDFIIGDDGPYYEKLGAGFSLQRIFEEELVLCCSKDFFLEHNIKKDFQNISKLPHLDYSQDASAVGIWYQFFFGEVPSTLELSLVSENVRALISGVKHHLGVAMIPKYMIKKELEKGAIVEISPNRKKLMNGYILVQHQSKIPSRTEKVFLEFVKGKNKIIE